MRFLPLMVYFLLLSYPVVSHASAGGLKSLTSLLLPQDTTGRDTVAQDSSAKRDAVMVVKEEKDEDSLLFTDRLRRGILSTPAELSLFPAISLQQNLKGEAVGLYVQESSGEPGSVQQMYIRGVPSPLFSPKDVYQAQPLVVLDGIPLVNEHPFAYDIQQYDFNRIGPATNLLTNIDINNIASVEIVKDPAALAIYGPLAANGVIRLTTKQAGHKRRISANAFFGMGQRPTVTTINGAYENAFRQQFYNLYTAAGRYSDDDSYPIYLADSLNSDYYGASNWTDSYYQNGVNHGITADISGGSDRANFRFSLGNARSDGIADNTGMDRYSGMFNVNMKPLKWLTFSAMLNGNRIERQRNRNLRDRFAQMNYIPDLQAPLAPDKSVYDGYLKKFDNSFDDNTTNIIEGHAMLVFEWDKIRFTSRLAVDYNEGYRDIFYPRPLMEGNSYVSNYYGFNQRMIYDNVAAYDLKLGDKHFFSLEAGNVLQWDTHKYNYAYAYKGVNDFIKLNLLESDPNKKDIYLLPTAFPRELVYKYLDRTTQNLVSFYGRVSYNFDQKYSISLVIRTDGSSNAQPTSRWLFTPMLSAGWNIRQDLLSDQSSISELNIRVSAGRIGRLNTYDNISQGPFYTAEVGYTGNKLTPGYNGMAALVRPYDFGWVGYGTPWAYTDQLNAGIDFGFFAGRLQGSLDWYTKYDKNQLLGIPSYAEFGYKQTYEAGMDVNNTGVELVLSGDIVKKGSYGSFGWNASLGISYNQNKLKALPGGLQELQIGDRLLKVGEAVDRFWLLSNDGIYTADADVPVLDGRSRTFNGIPLQAGDPEWRDLNGDNRIDNNDKTLKGHIFPQSVGSFHNRFAYGNWSLDANLYFNLGRQVINQEMANRFDFINREGTIDMNAVKEISYWEKRGDYNKYPLYNPWSTVMPYQAGQDLFLENGSFLKLRTLSLGYDLSSWLKDRKSPIEHIYLYGTVNNLFTVSPYSGRDPELVNYTGYDNGYGMVIPRIYTIGVKMDL